VNQKDFIHFLPFPY